MYRVFFLAAAWLGVAAAAPASQLLDNLNAGKSQVLVLYGTSETQFGRWADPTPGHGGISDWLTGLYGDRITVINSGMAGKASNTGVANLDKQVLAHHPDTVLLEFAINDAYTGYLPTVADYQITPEKCRANLNAMIDRILAANPHTEIILQTMNPAADVNGKTQGSQRPELAAYYQVYRDVAGERGFLLVDHWANWVKLQKDDPAKFQADLPDGLHPIPPASLAVTLPAIERALGTPAPVSVSAPAP